MAPRVGRHYSERRVLFHPHLRCSAPSGQNGYEDGLESPLIELGLIKATGRRDGFRFVRGPKPSLGPGVFGYAVTDFWERSFGNANTLSFEALTHAPGSPGRAFLLDENDMVDLLLALEDSTDAHTGGLRRPVLNSSYATGFVSLEESFEFLEEDYRTDRQLELTRAFG